MLRKLIIACMVCSTCTVHLTCEAVKTDSAQTQSVSPLFDLNNAEAKDAVRKIVGDELSEDELNALLEELAAQGWDDKSPDTASAMSDASTIKIDNLDDTSVSQNSSSSSSDISTLSPNVNGDGDPLKQLLNRITKDDLTGDTRSSTEEDESSDDLDQEDAADLEDLSGSKVVSDDSVSDSLSDSSSDRVSDAKLDGKPVLDKKISGTGKSDKKERVSRVSDEYAMEGIDTVDLEDPQGNWLFKRIWWERAQDAYDKIRAKVQKIADARIAFFTRRTKIDQEMFDPLYRLLALEHGESESKLVARIAALEERHKAGTLSAFEGKQDQIKQLQDDVIELDKLYLKVNGIVSKLGDVTNRVKRYEQDSWQQFKEIATILNDEKARELSFKIEGALHNIENIEQYLKDQLDTYFGNTLADIKAKVDRIRTQVAALEAAGIQVSSDPRKEQVKASDIEEDDAGETEESVWTMTDYIFAPFHFVWSAVTTVTDTVSSAFGYIYHLVTGSASVDTVDDSE